MAMSATDIERFIKEALPDAVITIRDLAGDGDHYAANVVSAAFKGKSRVQQHQMVYAALKGRMGGELHALALQTSTRAHAADFPGRGDNAADFLVPIVPGTTGVITGLQSHGSAPYTRFNVQFDNGTRAYGLDPAALSIVK